MKPCMQLKLVLNPMLILPMQKLLLLPELEDEMVERSGDPDNTTRKPHLDREKTTIKLASGEETYGLGSLSNELSPTIVVSNLTASWTQVRYIASLVCTLAALNIGKGEASIEQYQFHH